MEPMFKCMNLDLNLAPKPMSFVAIASTHLVVLASCSGVLLVEPLNSNRDNRSLQVNSNRHAPQAPAGPGQEVLQRFLMPVSECSFQLEAILEDLRKDPWPVPAEKRVARATGSALSVATSLLHLAIPRRGARIMLFTGGPCTSGPGQVVSRMKEEDMRSHQDLAKKAEPLLSTGL